MATVVTAIVGISVNVRCSRDQHRASDRDNSCGRYPVKERLYRRMFSILLEIRRGNYREEISWNERGQRCHYSSPISRYQITDESSGDNDWSWSAHCYSHGIDKLLLIQPLIFFDNTAVQILGRSLVIHFIVVWFSLCFSGQTNGTQTASLHALTYTYNRSFLLINIHVA